jgi:hypothetical protein
MPNFECEVPRFARDDNSFHARRYAIIGSKASYRFLESFFFAQFCQHAEILQCRRIAGDGFATGNFLE